MRTLLMFTAVAGLTLGAALSAPAQEAAGELPPDSLAADSVLSLAVVERLVLQRNPEIEGMRQALSAARARVGMEGSLMDPRIEVSAAPGTFGDESGAVYRVGVEQMLPLATLGSRRGVARAEARVDSAEVERTRLEMLRMAREAFAEYVRGTASLLVVRELQSLTEQFRKVALARYASALVGESDPLMAETEGARLEHEAIMSIRMRETAKARLNSLLRRPWDAPLPPPPPPGPTQEVPPVETLVSWAVRLRPEVAAAAARQQVGAARLRLAGREALPELGVMGAYDRFMLEEPMRWMVGVSFTLPLWWGRIGAGRAEARAMTAEAQALTVAARDRVAFEVREAYLRVVDSAHEAQLFREAEVPVSQRALGAALAGYESGRNDFLTLLNAERELGRVRLEEIRILADHQVALADLERAVGAALPATPETREGGRR